MNTFTLLKLFRFLGLLVLVDPHLDEGHQVIIVLEHDLLSIVEQKRMIHGEGAQALRLVRMPSPIWLASILARASSESAASRRLAIFFCL